MGPSPFLFNSSVSHTRAALSIGKDEQQAHGREAQRAPILY